MSQEQLIRQGILFKLEEEKKVLSARARAGLYVLRGVFSDVQLQLDPARHMDLDLDMTKAVVQDLQSIQDKYREITRQINELK